MLSLNCSIAFVISTGSICVGKYRESETRQQSELMGFNRGTFILCWGQPHQ